LAGQVVFYILSKVPSQTFFPSFFNYFI